MTSNVEHHASFKELRYNKHADPEFLRTEQLETAHIPNRFDGFAALGLIFQGFNEYLRRPIGVCNAPIFTDTGEGVKMWQEEYITRARARSGAAMEMNPLILRFIKNSAAFQGAECVAFELQAPVGVMN